MKHKKKTKKDKDKNINIDAAPDEKEDAKADGDGGAAGKPDPPPAGLPLLHLQGRLLRVRHRFRHGPGDFRPQITCRLHGIDHKNSKAPY